MTSTINQADARVWLQMVGARDPMDPHLTAELAGIRVADAQETLERLVHNRHVVRYAVFPGECWPRYAVTGTCLVPPGLPLAELVAEVMA